MRSLTFLLALILKPAWVLTDGKIPVYKQNQIDAHSLRDVLLRSSLGEGSLYERIWGQRLRNGTREEEENISLSRLMSGEMDLEDILKDETFARRLSLLSPLYAVRESCLNGTIKYLHALLMPKDEKNLTAAITMLDASSKPPNGILRDSIEYCDYITNYLGLRKCPIEEKKLYIPFGNTKAIGNHIQCHRHDDIIPARYCRVGLTRKGKKKLVKPSLAGVVSAMNWEWGMCIPEACSPKDVERNLKFLFLTNREASVEVLSCEEPLEYSVTSIPLGIFWGLFTAAVLILSIENIIIEPKKAKHISLIRYLKSTVQTEAKPNSWENLRSLSGIMSLSLLWIILSSTLRAFMGGSVINQMDTLDIQLKKDSSPPLYNVILNDSLPFDVLFLGFGAAIAYWVFKITRDSGLNAYSFLFDIYVRLTIPVVFTYMIMVVYVPYATQGPFYEPIQDNGFVAQILHLSNFNFLFNEIKNEDMNYTWFISCLMQLILVTLGSANLLKKYPKTTGVIWGVLFVLSVILFESVVYLFNFPPSLLSSSFETQSKFDLVLPENYYQLPWARLTPFLMGILVSYVICKHEEKDVKIARVLNIGMWIISFISIGFCMGSASLFRNDTVYGKSIWSPIDSVIYTLFTKILLSIGIGWIVYACHRGLGGIMNAILSWGPFLVMSRTLVTSYLMHHAVILVVLRSSMSSYEFTGLVMAQYFNAIAVITISVSIIIHALTVEPFMKEYEGASNESKVQAEEPQEQIEQEHKDQIDVQA